MFFFIYVDLISLFVLFSLSRLMHFSFVDIFCIYRLFCLFCYRFLFTHFIYSFSLYGLPITRSLSSSLRLNTFTICCNYLYLFSIWLFHCPCCVAYNQHPLTDTVSNVLKDISVSGIILYQLNNTLYLCGSELSFANYKSAKSLQTFTHIPSYPYFHSVLFGSCITVSLFAKISLNYLLFTSVLQMI